MINHSVPCLGEFRNEADVWFTYGANTQQWGMTKGFPHEIHTIDGARSAIVKKTRVIVCVDEDEFGNPVTETWTFKKHNVYCN